MTNSERAEKIVKDIDDYAEWPLVKRAIVIDDITTQLDEACGEAGLQGFQSGLLVGIQQGFATARKKAAGVVLEVKSNVPTVQELLELFAKRIRGMTND